MEFLTKLLPVNAFVRLAGYRVELEVPKQYEAIRDSLIKKGKSPKAAKTMAAKIYNSKRGKKAPVTKGSK